jgi:uncharacterized protein (TIGR03435 family)
MILRPFVNSVLLAALASPAIAQSAPPAFPAVDVHPAPRRSYPFFYAVLLKQDRYVARDATLVDLIATAYSLNNEEVQGGPSWLERHRFDIIAKVPAGTSKDALKLMLRNVLKDRFQLTFHDGTKAMPAYVLRSVKPKLKQSDSATGESKCDDKSPPYAGPASLIHVACTNMTMDNFVHELHGMAGGYLDQPVVNSTGLEGAWDFEIKWTGRGDLEKAGPDGISIFDAVDQQLGLRLTLQTAPRPVMLVDSVTEKPTPNAPDIEKILPPTSAPQFEVATIKPSKPGEHGEGRISGGVVNFTNIRLKDMIDLAWDLNENDSEVLVNAPKWVNDDRYDILAKVSRESNGTAASTGSLPMDIYEVQLMLQALLIDRFQMKAHMEDRPISSYVLIAPNPKLKPADPTARTICKEGPGPDGKDPRLTNPVLNRLITCQNMSTQQIGEELQHIAGAYIYNPVLDQTGLKGSYDFTLSFSSADRVLSNAGGSSSSTPSEPNGAVSVFDAINHQLGLKLEKQKRPLPVLVIDHIEEKPTEN